MVARQTTPADPLASDRRPLVLCVDDETATLAALTRALRSEAYRFETTDDPELAIDWVRTRTVSLILADYHMRGLSGTSLLQMVKAASPGTIRILLTGSAQDPWIGVAEEKGLLRVFGKPWDDDALRKMIRDRLESGTSTGGGMYESR
ncbi:MAG TPA: response regulator [Planctomycetota bacterium]|nr:response regulator [Planctomycetota bacterium]